MVSAMGTGSDRFIPYSSVRFGPAVAAALLEIEAVHIRPNEPFVLTSGLLSPVYVDCRKVIAFPKQRNIIIDAAVETLREQLDLSQIDAIAGGETAGIPYAAWIADRLNLPMLYIRKKPKGFGRNAQIEGSFAEGARVLLVEDLATNGGSKEVFVKALRDAGAVIDTSIVVFFYNYGNQPRLPLLEALGVRLLSLATWNNILALAEQNPKYKPAEIAEVKLFLSDLEKWSAAHGGMNPKP
ncbi:MAG: orotate phosphoribosyltransferase [Candidatus Pacebacteria bacterium]|nr:orotate phosphoribosyltransferase [Candidatus Paceibacterota bacterium]